MSLLYPQDDTLLERVMKLIPLLPSSSVVPLYWLHLQEGFVLPGTISSNGTDTGVIDNNRYVRLWRYGSI